MTPPAAITRRLDARGYSLLELLTVLGIVGVLTAVAIPRFQNTVFDLEENARIFADHLRISRTLAISRGIHYRVRIDSTSSFQVFRRVVDPDTSATVSEQQLALDLKAGLEFVATTDMPIPTELDFDSRGYLITPATPVPFTIALEDTRSGQVRVVTVWPSGQVLF